MLWWRMGGEYFLGNRVSGTLDYGSVYIYYGLAFCEKTGKQVDIYFKIRTSELWFQGEILDPKRLPG